MAGKLRSKWSGPFMIKEIFSNGGIEVYDHNGVDTFVVNGHRLKPYHELAEVEKEKEECHLLDPVYDSGSTQPPARKRTTKPRPPTKRTTRRTASEETSIKATEEPVIASQTEEKGLEDVPAVEEREVEKETSEEMIEVSEKPMEKEQPAPTPPIKKPMKALKKSTPAQTTKERETTPVLPTPPAPSLEEGKTATGSEEGEEEGEEATHETEVEASTPQSKVVKIAAKRKLDVTKPPLPTKTKPAAAGSKTKGKEVQSKGRKATPAEKGKGKQDEEDPERTKTVDSSRSADVLAPKKPTSSTATTAKPKLTKQKGLIRTTASGVVIPRDSQRYAVLQKREITPWYFMVNEALDELGIKERVEGYFDGIGWKKVLEWNPKAFQKLTEEFMGTVEFKPKGNYTIETPGTLRF
ncbi:uncharacterized protein LOC131008369 [Salvia miltiorrhiza]|uniref:uncharacterized protein LOC131008369 n=1 Tax=Salvia miltiorrhiza TaxID=226208 RepID=UPI0025AD4285|nr:uncharacterized protein LOC131008369 [Salvia miltiorrhiza]